LNFDFAVIISNAKFLLLQGLLGIGIFAGGTLRLAIPAILGGFCVGVILGLARLARRPWIHYPATVYIEFIRGIPLVMVIFWFWFLVPVFLRRPVPEYWVALTAFVCFESAYIGEIVRAGIQSVPRGQVDMATATGLSYIQMMWSVILPQAIRNMIPSLVTQFIVLFKDTSLASIIGMMSVWGQASVIKY
jgi:polar amino acid transport system permease protein